MVRDLLCPCWTMRVLYVTCLRSHGCCFVWVSNCSTSRLSSKSDETAEVASVMLLRAVGFTAKGQV